MSSPVRSVVQALSIIRELSKGPSLTLSEIAQNCDISPSSCLGLLRTLAGEGVLELTAGKRYTVTSGWRNALGIGKDPMANLISRAKPLLVKAARDWRATLGLWRVVAGDRMQLVILGESPAPTRIHMVEGQRQPIGMGALGCAIAAMQRVSPDELSRRHASVRWERPYSFDEFTAAIAQATKRGWAVDNGRSYPGITSVAVALPKTSPSACLCLSASVFAGSRTDSEIAAMAKGLRQLGKDLEAA